MIEPTPHPRLSELVLRSLEGDLTPAESTELATLLQDPAAQDHYVHLIQLCTALPAALAANAPAIPYPTPKPRPSLRWLKRAALILLPLLAAAALYALTRTPTATLHHTSFARFDTPLDAHQSLPAGPISLTEGLAHITLSNGTSLILQAPARFQVDSNKLVHLYEGRLSASVPPQAHGFTVQTATALVTDLGTEFAVLATPSSTDVHVFTGRVQTSLASSASPLTLTAGQSAHLDHTSLTLDPAGARPNRFARTTATEPLNLIDILSGGDGTTRRRNIAIDAATGQSGHLSPTALTHSDNRFHPVPALPLLDGTFIPDGSAGPVTISSAGDTFPFPPTSALSFNRIYTGGSIPVPSTVLHVPVVFDRIDYANQDHSLLFMGGNKGLTLDLAKLRAAHDGRPLLRLQSSLRLSSPQKHPLSANAYVLVDGSPRFAKTNLTPADGFLTVDLPLFPDDHFLTLATTTPSSDPTSSGLLWIDPQLLLVAAPSEKK